MEQFGWTEEELYEKNTLERVMLISEYNTLQKVKHDEESRRAKSEAASRKYR